MNAHEPYQRDLHISAGRAACPEKLEAPRPRQIRLALSETTCINQTIFCYSRDQDFSGVTQPCAKGQTARISDPKLHESETEMR